MTVEERTDILLTGSKGRELRRVWLRFCIFLVPIFLLLGPAVYWVDPYEFFHHASPIPEPVSAKYGRQINQALWKVIAYARNPEPNILVGDSQIARFPEKTISAITGEPYSNLGYGGGTLRESISSFWFAARRTNLKRVYFSLCFMTYTAYPRDRVVQAEAIIDNPALYFMNFDVLEAGTYDVADVFFHYPVELGPGGGKDAFWQSQLHYLETRYKREADPGSLKQELHRIVDYCRSHNISLVFVLPPQHVDAQRRISELGVEQQYTQFKSDLAKMAPVYDCDIDSSFARNRDNFGDPFHLEFSAAEKLVEDLWSGKPRFCRTLGSFETSPSTVKGME